MNKKMCFMIFVATAITTIVGYLFDIGSIKVVAHDVFHDMTGVYVCAAGVLIGLLFFKNKYYWLLVIPLALIAGALIQFFVLGDIGSMHDLLIRAAAVAAYGYLTALIRFMIR